MTPSQAKRLLKTARNFFKDPLPRRRTLIVKAFVARDPGIVFEYLVEQNEYTVKLTLPEPLRRQLELQSGVATQQALSAIAVALAAHFFKLTDFLGVEIHCAPVDQKTLLFFERFFLGGLGEFRYLQGLDPTRRIHVTALQTSADAASGMVMREHALMLNGGGKDTVVAAEMLKRGGQSFTWLTVHANDTRRKIVELSGNRDSVEIEYELDPRIEQQAAYAWGHVPQVSIFLAIGTLVALLTQTRYVVVGNERSSNYGNLSFRGSEINHQYTKSFAYERDFHDFVRRRVCTGIDVCSVLRPFHDVQLAELFASLKNYHRDFVSCNRGIRNGQWCRQCEKCAFTALALGPFLARDELSMIFGEDVLARPGIRRHIIALACGDTKPWECVGTKEECQLALRLLLDRYPALDFPEYPRRKDLALAAVAQPPDSANHQLMDSASDEHLIAQPLLGKLNAALGRIGERRLSIPRMRSAPERHSAHELA